jgi:hypothetical protein
MTSQELAAWVQAVGSILAILGAAYIASWRHRVEIRERASRAQQLAKAMGDQVQASILEMKHACLLENRSLIGQPLMVIREALELGRSVDVSALPPKAISPFMSLRVAASEAQGIAAAIEASSTVDFRKVGELFDRTHSDATKAHSMLTTLLDAATGAARRR